jgi:hypothetical protein
MLIIPWFQVRVLAGPPMKIMGLGGLWREVKGLESLGVGHREDVTDPAGDIDHQALPGER